MPRLLALGRSGAWAGVACLALLAGAGCKKGPPEAAASWEVVPRLPSPSAGTYARAPAQPTDPPLVPLMAGHTWDASLAGAASAAALQLAEGEATPTWLVRHDLWRAGYPYPVDTLTVWKTPVGAPPPPDLTAWLEARPAEADIGLVRARSQSHDVWVALTAQPRGSIGVQPRQLPLEAAFTLPVLAGATFEVADGVGSVRTGRLDLAQTFTVDVAGEWLVKVSDAQGTVARFPIYVQQTPPTAPVLALDVPEGTLAQQADALIDQLREGYDRDSLEADLLFQSAAAKLLGDPSLDTPTLAGRLGWPEARLARWDVHAATLLGALDQVIWEPAARAALLAPSGQIGVAAAEEEGRVHLVVLVGFDE